MTTQNNTIQLNVSAPTFKLDDVFGRVINLDDYRGKKVYLGFFRNVGCPFCNLRVHKLSKIHEELKAKGLEMIFFFESPKNAILNSTFHREVSPIPIISDPERIWYETYGLEQSQVKSNAIYLTKIIATVIKAKLMSIPAHNPQAGESPDTMPAEFLLDEGLIIREMFYSNDAIKRMDIDHIIDFSNKPLKSALQEV